MSTISSVRSAIGLALEEVSENRNAAQPRDTGGILLRQVVKEARNRERLTVAKLDVG
jgi:hypothetical protein